MLCDILGVEAPLPTRQVKHLAVGGLHPWWGRDRHHEPRSHQHRSQQAVLPKAMWQAWGAAFEKVSNSRDAQGGPGRREAQQEWNEEWRARPRAIRLGGMDYVAGFQTFFHPNPLKKIHTCTCAPTLTYIVLHSNAYLYYTHSTLSYFSSLLFCVILFHFTE